MVCTSLIGPCLTFPTPHLPSGILGAWLDMAGGPQQGHHCPGYKPEGWACGLSAALIRNAPTSRWEGATDSGTPALQSCPVLPMLLHLPGRPVGQGTPGLKTSYKSAPHFPKQEAIRAPAQWAYIMLPSRLYVGVGREHRVELKYNFEI